MGIQQNMVKHLHFTIQKRISRDFNQEESSVLHQPGTSGIARGLRDSATPAHLSRFEVWITFPVELESIYYMALAMHLLGEDMLHEAKCTVHELYFSN